MAARGSLVAVSAWRGWLGDHVVRLFEGSGAMWTAVRVLAGGFRDPGREVGQLNEPAGLRFTADGTGLVVADWRNHRVSRYIPCGGWDLCATRGHGDFLSYGCGGV